MDTILIFGRQNLLLERTFKMFFLILIAFQFVVGLAPHSNLFQSFEPVLCGDQQTDFVSSYEAISSKLIHSLPEVVDCLKVLSVTKTTHDFKASVQYDQGYPVFSLPFVHGDWDHKRTHVRFELSGSDWSEEAQVKAFLAEHYRQKGFVFSTSLAPPYALLNKNYSRVILCSLQKEDDHYVVHLAFEELLPRAKKESNFKEGVPSYLNQRELFDVLKYSSENLPFSTIRIPNVSEPDQFEAFKYFFASSTVHFEVSIKGKEEEMLKNVQSFLSTLLIHTQTPFQSSGFQIEWSMVKISPFDLQNGKEVSGSRIACENESHMIGTLPMSCWSSQGFNLNPIIIELSIPVKGRIEVEIKEFFTSRVKKIVFFHKMDDSNLPEGTFLCQQEKSFEEVTEILFQGILDDLESRLSCLKNLEVLRLESTSPLQKPIDKRVDTLPSVFSLLPVVEEQEGMRQTIIRNAQPVGSFAHIRFVVDHLEDSIEKLLETSDGFFKTTNLGGNISAEVISHLPLPAYIDKDTIHVLKRSDGSYEVSLGIYYNTLSFMGLKPFVDSLEYSESNEEDSVLKRIHRLSNTFSDVPCAVDSQLNLSDIFKENSPFRVIDKSVIRTTDTLDMVKGEDSGSWEVPRTSSSHYDTATLTLVFDPSLTNLTAREALRGLFSDCEIFGFEVSDPALITGRHSSFTTSPSFIYHIKEKKLKGTQILVVSLMMNRQFLHLNDDLSIEREVYQAPEKPFLQDKLPRIRSIIEELGGDVTFFINASGGAIGFQSLRALLNSGSRLVITMKSLEKTELLPQLTRYLELILTSPTPSSSRFIDYIHLTGYDYQDLDSHLFSRSRETDQGEKIDFYMQTQSGVEVLVAIYTLKSQEILFVRTQTHISLIKEERKPEKIKWPWDQTDTPVVLLDASGVFKSEEKLSLHFSQPGSFSQPVLFMPTCPGEKNSTPPNEQKISLSVIGTVQAQKESWVQQDGYIKRYHSPASCTTNGITPFVDNLLKLAKSKNMSVLDIYLLTLHAPTNSQETLISPVVSNKSSIFSSVHSTTGAVKSIGQFLNLKGVNVGGGADRLPQLTGSVGILDIILEGDLSLSDLTDSLQNEKYMSMNLIEKTSDLMKKEVDRNALMDLNLTHFKGAEGHSMTHIQVAVGYENEAHFTEMMFHNALETIGVAMQLRYSA